MGSDLPGVMDFLSSLGSICVAYTTPLSSSLKYVPEEDLPLPSRCAFSVEWGLFA